MQKHDPARIALSASISAYSSRWPAAVANGISSQQSRGRRRGRRTRIAAEASSSSRNRSRLSRMSSRPAARRAETANRSEHHAIRAHHIDEQPKRAGSEHRRVDAEPVTVVRRRMFRPATRDVAVVPGILEPPEQEREAAAAVREADFRLRGSRSKRRRGSSIRSTTASRPACPPSSPSCSAASAPHRACPRDERGPARSRRRNAGET